MPVLNLLPAKILKIEKKSKLMVLSATAGEL